MSRLDIIRARSTWSDILKGQPQHLAMVTLMALGALSLLSNPANAPHMLGLSSYGWAVTSIVLAIVHQLVVALVFRLQLHRNMMTRLFGTRDMAIWAVIFMPLLIARPLTIIMTGWADTTPPHQPAPRRNHPRHPAGFGGALGNALGSVLLHPAPRSWRRSFSRCLRRDASRAYRRI